MRTLLKIAFGMFFLFSTTFFVVHVVGKVWNDQDVPWIELAQLSIIDAAKITVIILLMYVTVACAFRLFGRNKE